MTVIQRKKDGERRVGHERRDQLPIPHRLLSRDDTKQKICEKCRVRENGNGDQRGFQGGMRFDALRAEPEQEQSDGGGKKKRNRAARAEDEVVSRMRFDLRRAQ